MTGDNQGSRMVGGRGFTRTGLTTEVRSYATGAQPTLARIEGALSEVKTLVLSGAFRMSDVKNFKELHEAMGALVDESERASEEWGG